MTNNQLFEAMDLIREAQENEYHSQTILDCYEFLVNLTDDEFEKRGININTYNPVA